MGGYIFKNRKKIIIPILILLILLGTASIYFVPNYKAYEHLNEVRDKVNLSTYKEKNFIVRDLTLSNMQEEIDMQISNYIKEYAKFFNKDETFNEQVYSILNSDEVQQNKYNSLTKYIDGDLKSEVTKKITQLREYDLTDVTFNKQEEDQYNEIIKEINSIIVNNSTIKENLNNYNTLYDLETELTALKEGSLKRVELEKKEEEDIKSDEKDTNPNNTLSTKMQNEEPAYEGNFNRVDGQNIFNAINEYRSSLGLTPYTYNSGMQSCVDNESMAYANTQNPHNWVCPVANENASLAPVGSDVVGISMGFFISDPPHEIVLSGNYTSAAISIYESGGMSYIIVGVF